jgi:hypothetical protein
LPSSTPYHSCCNSLTLASTLARMPDASFP